MGTFISTLIMFLIFFDVNTSSFPWFLGFAFHISVIVLLLGFIQKDRVWYSSTTSIRDSETIIEDTKSLAIIIVMAGIVNFFGLIDTISNVHQNVFSLAVSILYAGYMCIIFGMSASLLFRLMYQRPHASVQTLTLWMIGLSILVLALQLFLSDILLIGIHILAGLIGFIGFYNTKGLQWFSGISKKQKTDLAWSSIVLLLSIIIIIGNYQLVTFVALNQIIALVEPFIITIGVWLTLVAGRLSVIAINSLPTAGLIDRKTHEFAALSQLTGISSTSQNYQHILEHAMQLIQQAIAVKGMYGRINIQNVEYDSYYGELATELSIINANDAFVSWKLKQLSIGNMFEIPEKIDPHKLLRIQSIMTLSIEVDKTKYAEILLAHDEPFHFTPEDEIMLRSFLDSLKIAIINASLLTIEIEHQKLEQEMEIARGVQHALLPQHIFSPKHYQIATYSMPAKMVGGDFYDVFDLHNGDTCIIIADVSGKGIPAAFWMATIRGVLLSLQHGTFSPKAILMHLQQSLAQVLDPQVFITASCLILEKDSSRIQFSRAGHLPLLQYTTDELTEYIPKGIGIGLTKSMDLFAQSLDEMSLELHDSEMIVLYTDGLTDLQEHDNELNQYSSLHRFLKESSADPTTFISLIDEHIHNHHKGALIDDITVIAIKRMEE